MKRFLAVSAVVGALIMGAVMLVAPAQAAPMTGLSSVPGNSAKASAVVDQAGWRRWRTHRRWWWRWRRW
jgi:hypothetical protein